VRGTAGDRRARGLPGPARRAGSPAHGFCDDEETRRLLRSRPPRQALAWAAARLGSPVISARVLRGGMSSAVHLLTVADGAGRRQAVLRRYVRPEVNAEDPGIADREARALRVAETVGVSTPTLLAVDPAGTEAGMPTVLMYQPPPWARYPRIWERAAEISHGPAPVFPQVLIHRDYHPGNVLWRRRTVSGVVDWQAVCTGPSVIDVAHCRVNLLTFGTAAAGQFTAWWQRASGAAYHPWADVITITGFLDDLREDWGSEQFLVEEMLGGAVAELGRNTQLPGTSLARDGHGTAESSAASRWRSMPRAWSWSRTGLGRPGTKPSGASCLRLRRLSCVPSGSRASCSTPYSRCWGPIPASPRSAANRAANSIARLASR
jgi:hypothetical protein